MRRYPLLLVNVVALAVAGCSSNVCGPSTCVGGCCTATGDCVSPTDQNCGTPGTSCMACPVGEACTSGICTKQNVSRCEATSVPCKDESFMNLTLFDTVNTATISEEGAAPNFKTAIDGRAGGLTPNTSYQYLSFTPTGLVKKDLSDETAFTSLDWDIAVRRFVIRLNGGVSGPSCVLAARTATGTTFDALTQTPAGLTWRTEEYFTEPQGACGYVPHPSGIGAPSSALSSFWEYQMCVQMTGNVYVFHLRDGRYVKMEVVSYYSASEQMTCDATGTVPMPNSAAVMRIRWGFIGAPP